MVTKTASKPLVTYHVVREPGRPAINQAGSDLKVAVEQATSPRAAAARPARPTNPVRGVEGRVSIFSARSFVRLATCLVGALHGVGAQAQVSSTPTALSIDDLHKPPGGLDDVVTLLSELGVEVFYVAQADEGDDASLSSMNAVLHGLCVTRGGGVLLQQDGPERSRTNPKIFFSDARRVEFDNAISKKAHQVGEDPSRGFADLWNSGCVSPYSVSSDPTKPNPLGNVINKAPHGTVVGLSKEFAFYLHGGPNTVRFPGRSETVPVPKPYQLAEPQLTKQNESYGLFQASSDLRPSALIVTTQTVTRAEVDELWNHFRGQFTVSMVPLEDGVQAMIVAPLSARSELMGLLQALTGRGVGPIRPPPPTTLDQRAWDSSYLVGGGAIAVVGETEEPTYLRFGLPSHPPESPSLERHLLDNPAAESALAMLAQWIQENLLVLAGAAGAAGACILVYKYALSGNNAGQSPGKGLAVTQTARPSNNVQSMHGAPRNRPEEGMSVWFERKPVSSHGTSGAAHPGRSPEEIAESSAQAIHEKQAEENGRQALKQYLQEKGVEFRAMLAGGVADDVADVAFQLSGIIRSTISNRAQLRRWLGGVEFMNGVNLEVVVQTVEDYERQYPQNGELARAAAMLHEHVHLIATSELEGEVEYKGRESSALRTSSADAGNGLQAASVANGATNAGATPAQVSIAEIFDFGRVMAAEKVPDGANVHGVRRGKDIFIPGPDIIPHWHLNRKFVLYKLSETHHVYIARGDKLYRAKAASVGLNLDNENLRDRLLLRVQAFILTGVDGA